MTRRWPDCNAAMVVPRENNIDLTLTCSKPALHLGKHHDYYSMFTWHRGPLADDADAIRRLSRVVGPGPR